MNSYFEILLIRMAKSMDKKALRSQKCKMPSQMADPKLSPNVYRINFYAIQLIFIEVLQIQCNIFR
jgi:hypothetical protein